MIISACVPESIHSSVLIGGIWGLFLYGLVSSLDSLFSVSDDEPSITQAAQRGGLMAFLYLEILDASFSFDGVIGAFAITQAVPIIMLGLGIGAWYVRSLTVYLVNKGTLDEYIYLEHGAHYAILTLAVLMLASTLHEIPEAITGLTGATLIGLSLLSSNRHNKSEACLSEFIIAKTVSLSSNHFLIQLKEKIMAISLTKGGNINLTKTDPLLKNIKIGLGWDVRLTDGETFDLDASVLMVKADG